MLKKCMALMMRNQKAGGKALGNFAGGWGLGAGDGGRAETSRQVPRPPPGLGAHWEVPRASFPSSAPSFSTLPLHMHITPAFTHIQMSRGTHRTACSFLGARRLPHGPGSVS